MRFYITLLLILGISTVFGAGNDNLRGSQARKGGSMVEFQEKQNDQTLSFWAVFWNASKYNYRNNSKYFEFNKRYELE